MLQSLKPVGFSFRLGGFKAATRFFLTPRYGLQSDRSCEDEENGCPTDDTWRGRGRCNRAAQVTGANSGLVGDSKFLLLWPKQMIRLLEVTIYASSVKPWPASLLLMYCFPSRTASAALNSSTAASDFAT